MAGVELERVRANKIVAWSELARNLEFLMMYYISFGFLPGLRHKI